MSTDTAPRKSPVESVDRALRLLLLVWDEGQVSVKQAAEELQVAPSTAHRLLAALAHRGLAVQDNERRYRPGPAIRPQASLTVSPRQLRAAAHGPLNDLHEDIGETVQLMTLVSGDIQFIDGVESRAVLRVGMRNGDRMPAFVSAGGKAMLAQLSNQQLEELYRGGLPRWPTSRITTLAELKRSMTTVRRAHFATNFEETEQGVVGLGVSVDDADGRPIAGLTTATPSIRFQRSDMERHVTALRRAAVAVQENLRSARP